MHAESAEHGRAWQKFSPMGKYTISVGGVIYVKVQQNKGYWTKKEESLMP